MSSTSRRVPCELALWLGRTTGEPGALSCPQIARRDAVRLVPIRLYEVGYHAAVGTCHLKFEVQRIRDRELEPTPAPFAVDAKLLFRWLFPLSRRPRFSLRV